MKKIHKERGEKENKEEMEKMHRNIIIRRGAHGALAVTRTQFDPIFVDPTVFQICLWEQSKGPPEYKLENDIDF